MTADQFTVRRYRRCLTVAANPPDDGQLVDRIHAALPKPAWTCHAWAAARLYPTVADALAAMPATVALLLAERGTQ